MKYRFFLLIILFAFMLTGCGTVAPDAVILSNLTADYVLIDGTQKDISEVYPEGAALALYDNGTCVLRLGADSCKGTWESGGSDFVLAFNDSECRCTDDGDTVSVSLFESGAVLVLSKQNQEQGTEIAVSTLLPAQESFNGSYSGTLSFSGTSGRWADYCNRTFDVRCDISVDSESYGTVLMFTDFFSDSVPFVSADCVARNDCVLDSTGGYIADMEFSGGMVVIELVQSEDSDVINISGTYKKLDDSFDFSAVFTK